MNLKHISIIFFVLVLMFSISAVCAANETITDANQNQDISVSPEEANNPDNNPQYNVSDVEDGGVSDGNYSYGNADISADVGATDFLPVLEISVNHDDNAPVQDYLDISIDYNGNSYDINNKNYFFTFSQNDDSVNVPNNPELVSISTSAKNNNFLLNVNFLNVSNQTTNLANSDNILGILWNMIISLFNSLFN
ncbi:MAG: hypothetical protein IK044_02995 [Methanobrevibacter sp.]|nr:hypothetical protein [Methanobrevibacter sp.]MBR6023920.1 hypothetical protein [Methanobrevibacter sp.]